MNIILICALAGICGTFLGCLIYVVIGGKSSRAIGWALAFAGGVMLSLVFFELIPEAYDNAGIPATAVGMIVGAALIMAIHFLVDKLTDPSGGKHKSFHSHELHTHIDHTPTDSHSMIRSGIMMLIAIGLHNIPEGMAIGSGGSHDAQLGLIVALMIALHNVPTGMAIAAPLIAGGMSRPKVYLLTAMSGLPTLAGGFLGMAVGNISDLAFALSLAGSGGTLLYVALMEIIPHSFRSIKVPYALGMLITGVLTGLLAIHFLAG